MDGGRARSDRGLCGGQSGADSGASPVGGVGGAVLSTGLFEGILDGAAASGAASRLHADARGGRGDQCGAGNYAEAVDDLHCGQSWPTRSMESRSSSRNLSILRWTALSSAPSKAASRRGHSARPVRKAHPVFVARRQTGKHSPTRLPGKGCLASTRSRHCRVGEGF